MLPFELVLLVFRHLDIASILACRSVSHEWRTLADENAIWRDLLFRRKGCKADLQLSEARGWTPDSPASFSDGDLSFPERGSIPMILTPPSPVILLPSPFPRSAVSRCRPCRPAPRRR
jgi:hypothetical protein